MASACTSSSSTPARSAAARASRSIPLERSTPVTAYPAPASSTACRPVPQPMSRIDAPFGSSRSSTRNAASRTLSVVKTSFMYCGA